MINTAELLPPTLNGNILMLNVAGLHNAFAFVQQNNVTQFSVRPEKGGTLMLSVPVTQEIEDNNLGLMHGARARAQDKPDPKPPTGGGNPDGTPPGGGTPGTPVLDKYTFTEARAA